MIAGRSLVLFLLLSLTAILVACIPDSPIDRASGSGNVADAESLTPIPEDGLPGVPELQLRALSQNIERGANRVAVMISLGAGLHDRVELAGAGKVEWSDGEFSDALPVPGEALLVETRRSDPTGDVFPIRLYLTNVSWRIGTDDDAEITSEEIVTQWGAFPVLSIETASRPPGFRVTYQAAGQRWVSSAVVRRDGRVFDVEGRAESFDDEYRPVAGSLRFGPDFTDLEGDLPLSASVDVRVAIGEMEIDLN
jgi:hypothetical protein